MPETNKYGVLVREQIKSLNIIQLEGDEEMAENCFQSASYDFRLGSQYFVPIIEADKATTCFTSDVKNLSEGEFLIIPPFSSAIISTHENMILPDNVTGRFDLRIKWALRGLIFQMGTQVEPGYNGKLFGLLYNMSDKPVVFNFKKRLLTGEFHFTSQNATIEPRKRITRVHLSEFLEDSVLSGSINKLLEKSIEAVKRVEELDKNVRSVSTAKWSIVLILTTVAISITLPLAITKMTYDKDDFPLATVSTINEYNDIKTDFQKLNKLMQEYHALDYLKDVSINVKNDSLIKLSVDKLEHKKQEILSELENKLNED